VCLSAWEVNYLFILKTDEKNLNHLIFVDKWAEFSSLKKVKGSRKKSWSMNSLQYYAHETGCLLKKKWQLTTLRGMFIVMVQSSSSFASVP